MKLTVVWVGRTKDRRIGALLDEYAERVRRYCRLEIVEVREAARDAAAGPRERVRREGERIIKAGRPGEYRIALDERGEEMSSEEFAAFLGRSLEGTPAGVTLILGGPFGLSDAVLEAARRRLALSRMTLTHEAARLVALDQVYRAFTILRGERYHH